MKKILSVIRVSTVKQETESQKQEMLHFCKSKGFKESEIAWIEASGASARKLNKKYLDMIDSIKSTILGSDSIKSVALWHLNRLGRVDTVLTDMKNWFIDNGIQVYVKEPSMTLLNEDGTVNSGTEIAWSIFATMIKQDTNELMAKFERGRNANRIEGKFNGGAFGAMYGYEVDNNGYIVPCSEEVKLINQIFTDYASGKYSIRSLAKEYRDRGITQRDGRKITDMWLGRLIQNTAYIGYNEETGREYKPIVDKELWESVKAVREGKDLGIRKTKESKNVNIAVKILKCKECGHNYVATREKYTCYKRIMAHRFTDKCENSVSISIDIMDNLLWLVARDKHIDYLQSANNGTVKEYEEKKAIAQQKAKESDNKINALVTKHDRIQDLYINGDLSKERYEAQKAKLNADRLTFKAELEKYIDEIDRLDKMIEELKNPSTDQIVKLGLDTIEINDKKAIKEIVNQHVRVSYVERIVSNGRKAIGIEIITKDDIVHDFIYYYTIKDKTKQLYMKHSDGREIEIGTLFIHNKTREEIRQTQNIKKLLEAIEKV